MESRQRSPERIAGGRAAVSHDGTRERGEGFLPDLASSGIVLFFSAWKRPGRIGRLGRADDQVCSQPCRL